MWVTCDDQRAVVVVSEVVWEERQLYRVREREGGQGGGRVGEVVDVDDPEGGGGHREVRALRRDRKAVCKRDSQGCHRVVERHVRVRVGGVDCDVRDPPEGEPSDGFDQGEHVPERWETAGHPVVVAHVKARRARHRDRVGGHEIRRAERADVLRLLEALRIEHELLDGRLCAGVVDDEERGWGAVGRGVDVHAERVKVVCGGVALEGQTVDGECAGDVEKEVTARGRVSEGTHDGVPGFSVGVAAEQDEAVGECAVGVEVIPESDVLAKVDVIGRGVFDAGAVGGPITASVVCVWEGGGGEDIVPDDAATAIDEDGL